MSGRYNDYSKGSSRSARDDSRAKKGRREVRERDSERERKRTRSRSPRREPSPPVITRSNRHSPGGASRSQNRDFGEKNKRSSQWESDSEEEVPAPPPPPRISKITMGFTKPLGPIKMSLGTPGKHQAVAKPAIASVFNEDDDDEPEEMPAEAKMRMRNIGRETPTSAGPNSFGKTKQGFCDAKKVFEKNLKEALETTEKPPMQKFPQTIYRIKGP